jgi:hypothetical protein
MDFSVVVDYLVIIDRRQMMWPGVVHRLWFVQLLCLCCDHYIWIKTHQKQH